MYYIVRDIVKMFEYVRFVIIQSCSESDYLSWKYDNCTSRFDYFLKTHSRILHNF